MAAVRGPAQLEHWASRASKRERVAAVTTVRGASLFKSPLLLLLLPTLLSLEPLRWDDLHILWIKRLRRSGERWRLSGTFAQHAHARAWCLQHGILSLSMEWDGMMS